MDKPEDAKADGRPRALKAGLVKRPSNGAAAWIAAFAVLACALFVIAVSNAAYEVTSPAWLTFHVLVRKVYSIIAFALAGFVLARATDAVGRAWPPMYVALCIGLYSALIEVGQRLFSGSHESLEQQSFDVACGLVGGAIGALIARWTTRRAH
jgi:hypothetical protein